MAFTLEVTPGWKTHLVSANGSQASILAGVFGGQELCSHERPTLGVTTVQLLALGLAMECLLLIWSLSDYGDEPLFAGLSCVLCVNWVGLTSLWMAFTRVYSPNWSFLA